MNAKQEAFAREYAIDRNATQAAIRAGYSRKTAEQQGSRLLRNVQVAERIRELDDQHADAADIDAAQIIAEYKRSAFASADEVATWPGGKWSDKLRALDALAEIRGLRGRLAGGQDAETEVPGVIVVPARQSRDEWAKKHGVVEVDEHGNPVDRVN